MGFTCMTRNHRGDFGRGVYFCCSTVTTTAVNMVLRSRFFGDLPKKQINANVPSNTELETRLFRVLVFPFNIPTQAPDYCWSSGVVETQFIRWRQ